MNCTSHQILFGLLNRAEIDGLGMQHALEEAKCIEGFRENSRERYHLEDQSVDGNTR
jgi:hypothetical protein